MKAVFENKILVTYDLSNLSESGGYNKFKNDILEFFSKYNYKAATDMENLTNTTILVSKNVDSKDLSVVLPKDIVNNFPLFLDTIEYCNINKAILSVVCDGRVYKHKDKKYFYI